MTWLLLICSSRFSASPSYVLGRTRLEVDVPSLQADVPSGQADVPSSKAEVKAIVAERTTQVSILENDCGPGARRTWSRCHLDPVSGGNRVMAGNRVDPLPAYTNPSVAERPK